jgi:hypothetical protein
MSFWFRTICAENLGAWRTCCTNPFLQLYVDYFINCCQADCRCWFCALTLVWCEPGCWAVFV